MLRITTTKTAHRANTPCLIGTCSKEGHHKESRDEACESANQCRKNERDETGDKLRIEAGDYAVFDFANEPTEAGECSAEI